MTDLQQLQSWLDAKETERLEFKEAKNNYDLDDLVKYATALANEGGGHMVLGVTARQPRQVVGSAAFRSLDKAKQILLDSLRLRVEAEELRHPNGRVVVFTIPSRPLGMPLHHKGAYWMRSGDQLVPMSTDQIRRILDESGPDFSAQICPGATLDDLDPAAIDSFRARWLRKSNNPTLNSLSGTQLLHDAGLLENGQVTYAALILLGRARSLTRHLGQAEIVWEYRAHDNYLEYQDRTDFRDAFFLMEDRLWEEVNQRNELQHYQDGLYVLDILTFNETVVREAILNAVSHRDYRMAGSVFVRQFPRKLEVESPGGLPVGISTENILRRQNPRNRRIAEVFRLCGLVERSGQGANRMFELSIKEGKAEPLKVQLPILEFLVQQGIQAQKQGQLPLPRRQHRLDVRRPREGPLALLRLPEGGRYPDLPARARRPDPRPGRAGDAGPASRVEADHRSGEAVSSAGSGSLFAARPGRHLRGDLPAPPPGPIADEGPRSERPGHPARLPHGLLHRDHPARARRHRHWGFSTRGGGILWPAASRFRCATRKGGSLAFTAGAWPTPIRVTA